MKNYEINVMNLCTYTIRGAESEEEAIIKAMDCFYDDDEFYGSEEAENVTEADCRVVWEEEI